MATDEDLAGALLDEANVAVVHGSAFGLPPYIRIAYALDNDRYVRPVKPSGASVSRCDRKPAGSGQSIEQASRLCYPVIVHEAAVSGFIGTLFKCADV